MVKSGNADAYYNLFYFEVNKDSYYYDENIKINASWELDYSIDQETSYIQIQLCNSSEDVLWNSSKYYDIGLNQDNWTIKIHDLCWSFTNSSDILFVKAYNFYNHFQFGSPILILIESIKINILKRNISCETSGLESSIKYGENLYFTAEFFCIENNSYLSNHLVQFNILFINQIIYREDLMTNQSGVIALHLSSIKHLRIGNNFLIFNISKNKFFKSNVFTYSLKVEKYPILTDLVRFKNNTSIDENIEFELLYYYINETIHPLINKTISVEIYINNIMKFNQKHITNNSGLLKVNISTETIELKQNQDNLLIKLQFNGSRYLQNLTTTFILDLELIQTFPDYSQNQLVLISFSSIGIVISSIIIYKKKKSKNKLLKEIEVKL